MPSFLAVETENLKNSDHGEPKANPARSRDQHDEAARVKLRTIPKMDVSSAETGKLLSKSLLAGVCANSLGLLPSPFEDNDAKHTLCQKDIEECEAVVLRHVTD